MASIFERKIKNRTYYMLTKGLAWGFYFLGVKIAKFYPTIKATSWGNLRVILWLVYKKKGILVTIS